MSQAQLNELLAKVAADGRDLTARQQAVAFREIARVKGEVIGLLAEYVGDDGIIKRQRLNTLLRDLESVERNLRKTGELVLEDAIDSAVSQTSAGVRQAAVAAVGGAAIEGIAFNRLDTDALRYVVNRFGDDGLVLSDRVWQLAGDQREALSSTLRSGIIRGQSFSELSRSVRQVVDAEKWKVDRLVKTEMATGQRVAEAYFAERSEVVKGVRIIRGRANRPDHRCTILSLQDRYGWGAGVFKPSDTEIYSPHPNCTSWLEYVLTDEYATGGRR